MFFLLQQLTHGSERPRASGIMAIISAFQADDAGSIPV